MTSRSYGLTHSRQPYDPAVEPASMNMNMKHKSLRNYSRERRVMHSKLMWVVVEPPVRTPRIS